MEGYLTSRRSDRSPVARCDFRLAVIAGAIFILLCVTTASAVTIDFIGIHELSVNTVSPSAYTSLPFSDSITPIPSGESKPFGEFTGEQLAPFEFHFTGAVRNGAFARTISSAGFTLEEPTFVRISGWADLLDGDGSGPAQFDVGFWGPSEIRFFFVTDGLKTFDEGALLPTGFYQFGYYAHAQQVTDRAQYDFVLTIPEPGAGLLLATGLGLLVTWRRRNGVIRSLLVALICSCLLLARPTSAEERTSWEMPNQSILCIAEQSVGFNWTKGAWVQTKFKPEKLVIKKTPIGEAFPGRCGTDQPQEDLVEGGLAFLHRCYNVRDFGSPYSPALSHLCLEYYDKQGGESLKIVSVNCENETLKFKPDGWFHYASVHEDLSDRPKNGYKDSLFVAVGHCSTM